MIVLIHGGDINAASNKISFLKKEISSIKELSGKETNFAEALIDLKTADLFSERRMVILEDFEDVDFSRLQDDENLILVLKYSKNLAANSKILKDANLKKIQVFQFLEKEETNIFPLVDLLAEKNPRALAMFEKYIDEWGGQYVLTMIFYMFRRMILKPKNAPSFVLQKMEKQKRNFSKDKIKEIYKMALETDFRFKSGLLTEKLGLTVLINQIIN